MCAFRPRRSVDACLHTHNKTNAHTGEEIDTNGGNVFEDDAVETLKDVVRQFGEAASAMIVKMFLRRGIERATSFNQGGWDDPVGARCHLSVFLGVCVCVCMCVSICM